MPAIVSNSVATNNNEFDTSTYALVTSGTGTTPSAMCLSADSTKFYQVDQTTGIVTGYDIAAGLPSFASVTLTATNPDFLGIAASPDGTRIYVTNRSSAAGADSHLFVLDPTTLANIGSSPYIVPDQPYGVVVTPDNAHVLICQESNANVIVLETVGFTTTANIGVGANPTNICINSAGTFAYCSNFTTPSVSVLDSVGFTLSATILLSGGSFALNLALTPDDQYLYVVNGVAAVAYQITTASNTQTDTIALTNVSQYLAFTSDSANVWFTESAAQIEVYSVPADALVHTIVGNGYRVIDIVPAAVTSSEMIVMVI